MNTTKLIRMDDVVWEEFDGQALLIQPRTGARWTLNASAVQIWKLCDGESSVAELARGFARGGSRAMDHVQREVAEFCDAMTAHGLLQPCATAAAKGAALTLTARCALETSPAFRLIGLGSGPRRRPSPRGNRGPG